MQYNSNKHKSKNKIDLFPIACILLAFCLGLAMDNLFFYNPYSKSYAENITPYFDINFSESAVNKLEDYYYKSGDKEYAVCLIGKYEEDIIYVSDADSLVMGDNESVSTEKCLQTKYIGTLHKHPNNVPYASHADVSSSYVSFNFYHNLIDVIQYEPRSFAVYTKNNWFYPKVAEYG